MTMSSFTLKKFSIIGNLQRRKSIYAFMETHRRYAVYSTWIVSIYFFRRTNGIFNGGLDAKLMATNELMIFKTARKFRFILGDISSITNPRIKWPLLFLILLHHITQMTIEILLLIGSKNKHSVVAPAALAREVHCLITPCGYILIAIWWRKKQVFIDIAQEVNEIFLYVQVRNFISFRDFSKINQVFLR